jgi:hypothetical protein
LAAAAALCAQIKATPRGGVLRRWWFHRTIALTWAEVARALESCPRASDRDVAYAAACAVVHGPWYLARTAVMRRLARGVVGHRVPVGSAR